MDQDQRRIAFLKVLIAAAWADERLSPPEIRTLSYYLQRLRVSAAEYETLRPLLEQPLRPREAQQLVEQQLRLLAGTEEQRTLIAAVEDLLASDDELLPAEEEFLRQVRRMTHDPPTAQVFVARLKTLWSGAAPLKRAGESHSLMDVFIRQRLLQYFRGRLALSRARSGQPTDTEEQIDDRELYRLVIWAGLLGRVALADRGLRPPEKDQLVEIIKHAGPVPEADLVVVADGSLDGSLDGIELATLVQEFLRLAEPQDIEMLLDSLFLVAAADGRLMQVEADVIHEIARGAGFSEQAFRASLERCKRRMTSGWN